MMDIASEPDDVLQIARAETGHGWMVRHDGHVQACFSTASDLAKWIETVLTPLDVDAKVIEPETHEPMPTVLQTPAELIERKPARLWRVFRGGKL